MSIAQHAKLALKRSSDHKSVIEIGRGRIEKPVLVGGAELFIAAGPCSVESREQMEAVSACLKKTAVKAVRGGAFKPRTSPYGFQGMGLEGLSILSEMSSRHQMPTVTEVMSIEQIEAVAEHADVLQVGSRNMQNFDLLKALGGAGKPVLLKRGLAATIEEFLLAAEYILAAGNEDVILCERGIRSFDSYTRNVLDLGAVVALKQLTHLPVIVDPSHATGKSELVADLARAAVAAGCDGLIVECHPDPARSITDARQALSLEEMVSLVKSIEPLARAVGRRLGKPEKRQLSLLSSRTKAAKIFHLKNSIAK